MRERVAQQVGEHLAQLVRIAAHDRRAIHDELHVARGVRRARVGQRVAGEILEVDAFAHGGGRLVQVREREQVLHEHPHAPRLLLDPAHRLLGLLALARGPDAK